MVAQKENQNVNENMEIENNENMKPADIISIDDIVKDQDQGNITDSLKKNVFGGYDKKSVDDMLSEMHNNLVRVKAQLEEQLQAVTGEKLQVVQDCKIYKQQLLDAEKKISELSATIHDMNEMEMTIDNQNKAIETMESTIQDQNMTIEQMDQTIKIGNAQADEMQRTISKQNNIVQDLEKKLSAQLKNVEELQKTVKEQKEEIKADIANAEKLNISLSEARKQNDEKRKTIEQLNQIANDYKTLTAKHTEIEKQFASLTKNHADLVKKNDEVQKNLMSQVKKNEEVQKNLNDQMKKNQDLQKNYSDQLKKTDDLTKNLNDAVKKNEMSVQSYNELSRKHTELTKNFEQNTIKANKMSEEINVQKRIIEKNKQQMNVYEQDIAKVNKEKKELEIKNSNLTAKMNIQKSDLEKVINDLKNQMKQSEEKYKKEIEELKIEKQKAEKQKTQTEAKQNHKPVNKPENKTILTDDDVEIIDKDSEQADLASLIRSLDIQNNQQSSNRRAPESFEDFMASLATTDAGAGNQLMPIANQNDTGNMTAVHEQNQEIKESNGSITVTNHDYMEVNNRFEEYDEEKEIQVKVIRTRKKVVIDKKTIGGDMDDSDIAGLIRQIEN